MYSIVVADEDVAFTTTLHKITERSSQKVKIIGYASTGGEAIAKTKEMRPDILILDVKLSEINGIEVVKRIRNFDSRIHIIVITAYDYFELAREFIGYHVDAFLVKPVSSDVLIQTLLKTIDALNKEKEERENEIEKDLNMKDLFKFAEYTFIYSLLFSGEYKSQLNHYMDLLRIGERGYMMNIEIKCANKEKSKNVERVAGLLYDCIKRNISKTNACAVGPFMMNRIMVYVCTENEDEERIIENQVKLSNTVLTSIRQEVGLTVSIGVGDLYEIENLHLSYEEAIRSLRYKREDEESLVHTEDVEENLVSVHKSYVEMERLLLESIRMGQNDSMDYFLRMLEKLKTLESNTRKNRIIELLVLTCHATRQEGAVEGANEGTFLDYISYVEEMEDLEEEELDIWAIKKFQYSMRAVFNKKASRVPYVINSAIAYIEKHYMGNISLDELANHVGLTPQYFSAYFKEETKVNFVDYVTKLRIDKAKELIRNSQMSVQETCFIVGYHDPNYFSRIFKKMEGITPTTYKKQCAKGRPEVD